MPNFRRYDRLVRCREGHLFFTTWIPLVSIKSMRLGGGRRFQHCPVGHHWRIVEPVDESSVTPEDVAEARLHHDIHLP